MNHSLRQDYIHSVFCIYHVYILFHSMPSFFMILFVNSRLQNKLKLFNAIKCFAMREQWFVAVFWQYERTINGDGETNWNTGKRREKNGTSKGNKIKERVPLQDDCTQSVTVFNIRNLCMNRLAGANKKWRKRKYFDFGIKGNGQLNNTCYCGILSHRHIYCPFLPFFVFVLFSYLHKMLCTKFLFIFNFIFFLRLKCAVAVVASTLILIFFSFLLASCVPPINAYLSVGVFWFVLSFLHTMQTNCIHELVILIACENWF